jgi:RNA polymerase sigma-70 factor (ECF subfamily)
MSCHPEANALTDAVSYRAAVRVADVRAQNLHALHERFASPLRRFFRSYRLNAADVEDLTQEVFVRLAGPRRQEVLRKPESFVFTLALNLVRDRARRLHIKALPKSVAVEKVCLSCNRPTPEECLDVEQRLQRVERLLRGLKPAARDAFFLHRIYGESHAEIAVRLRISVSMVEKHLMSAVASLQKARVV